MTCIVGLKHNNKIYIGADSGVYAENRTKFSVNNPKVFINGALIIGGTSSFYMLQLLQHKVKFPENIDNGYIYMYQNFIDIIRPLFKDAGFTEIKSNTENGGEFIVGLNNELYLVGCGFSILQSTNSYLSCGCGEQLAFGSVYTSLLYKEQDPEKIIRNAINAASHHNPYVDKLITILSK